MQLFSSERYCSRVRLSSPESSILLMRLSASDRRCNSGQWLAPSMCRIQLLSNDNSSSCEHRSKPCQQQLGIRIRHTEGHPFNGLFSRTTEVSRHQKRYTSLEFNEARHNGVTVASVGPYVNHLHLTMPAPHHSFLQAGCSSWRLANSIKAQKTNWNQS